MDFKEFKKEIEKRCRAEKACQPEFKRILSSTNFKEILKVITDNFFWSCEHKIIDVNLLIQIGKEICEQSDIFYNQDTDKGFLLVENSTVTAWGNSTVTAWGNSTVTAGGNSTVTAWENSTVTAGGNSTVTARENSTVTARENSTVTARENSTVTAWGNSTVKARENSTVTAWENSTVKAWENSTVTAWGNSYILSYNIIEHKLNDAAILRHYYSGKVFISSKTEIETYDKN